MVNQNYSSELPCAAPNVILWEMKYITLQSKRMPNQTETIQQHTTGLLVLNEKEG
jgi:hypothetical protein